MTPLLTILAVANCSLTSNSINDSCTGLPKAAASSSTLRTGLAIFFGIAAVISLLMIIIGAFMFVTSGGNPQSTTKARETIIYAIVGLVVSLLAEAIVGFILGSL